MAESGNVRRLTNWITSFVQQTEAIESPEIFRRWAAIGTLSAVLERRVWSFTKGTNLYPNLYVALVAPPGIGKSAVIGQCETMLRNIEELFIAPSSVTAASLIDTLFLAQRKIVIPARSLVAQFNSVQIFSSELQNFLPAYEAAFMGVLTKLYDCELYEERRRTGKVQHIRIDNTQLSMVAGTTPSYLNGFLPEGAWDQGFMSRVIMVYSGEASNAEMFPEGRDDYKDQLYHDLVADLRYMMSYYGQIEWTDAAKHKLVAWINDGENPKPQHSRLQSYNARRRAHMIKLSVVACIARGDTELKVTADDVTIAFDWLFEAEATIPDIFKSMIVTNEARIMQDAHYFLITINDKTHKPVPEHYLVNFLKDRIPSQNIKNVIDIMQRSKMIQLEFNSPIVCYTPIRKKD